MSEQTMEIEKQEETAKIIKDSRSGRTFIPRVDIYEANNGVVLMADMPGVDETTVDITLEKNVLTIQGKVNRQMPDTYRLAYAEYRVGDYKRQFTLSDEVDRDGIEATVKNGVLRLVLPKAESAKAKKITVRADS